MWQSLAPLILYLLVQRLAPEQGTLRDSSSGVFIGRQASISPGLRSVHSTPNSTTWTFRFFHGKAFPWLLLSFPTILPKTKFLVILPCEIA